MNAKKIFLFGIIATICLPASLTLAGSRSSRGAVSASHASASRSAFTASRGNFASTSRIASNRAAFTRRGQTGLTSVAAARSLRAQRFNQGGNSRIAGNRGAFASSSARRWSGNGNWHGHHRHHHRNFVFVGGFYPYSWYYPYSSWYDPYEYGYYSSAQPVYDGAASYDDGSLVAQLQSRLARGGFYQGAIDGVMGPETRRAIRSFERRNGLPVDGLIDDQLLSTMGLG
jgi:hypothetical protein